MDFYVKTFYSYDMPSQLCIITGIIIVLTAVIRVTLWLISRLYVFFIASPINFKQYGSWAIVTGCTDGIGWEYAAQLAKHGLNLVLISRNSKKLDEQAEHLKNTCGVETKIIAVDFQCTDGSIYSKIQTSIEGLDIGLLINNVGMSTKAVSYFHECDDSQLIQDIIFVNNVSCVCLTHMILPQLIAKKRGIIVNVGSGAALYPGPLASIYCGTKSFIHLFSKSIQYEYPYLTIQDLTPLFVTTKLSKIRDPIPGIPTPLKYVKQALCSIGRLSSTAGCFSHDMQEGFRYTTPYFILSKIMWKIFSMRRTAQKKSEARLPLGVIEKRFKPT